MKNYRKIISIKAQLNQMPVKKVKFNDPIEKAKRAIERRSPIALDLASEHGQIFENVCHIKWFINELAEEIVNG